jgi:hypothetical protein
VEIDLVSTRRSLHAVAELVLAGPQYRAHGDIRLRVTPGGFGTVTGSDVRVDGSAVVRGELRCVIAGKTPAVLAAELGLQASNLEDVYHDGSGVGIDDVLALSPAHTSYLTECFAIGDDSLAQFAPDAERVLWPEHFDVGCTVDMVNYGISPGDGYSSEPYAYVGPLQVTDNPFWNAPFGASRRLGRQPAIAAIIEFFTAGRAAHAEDDAKRPTDRPAE